VTPRAPAQCDLMSKVLDPGDKYLGSGDPARRKAAADAWMKELDRKNYSGPTLDAGRYLTMRDDTITGNPRQTKEYRRMCREAVGVGDKPDMENNKHAKPGDFDVIRWVVSRGSGCMWLLDTPRTTAKGFKHGLIRRGPLVRGELFRTIGGRHRMDREGYRGGFGARPAHQR